MDCIVLRVAELDMTEQLLLITLLQWGFTVYDKNEFQKEKIVELSTTKYRIKKNLPISSFVYELSIPTVYEALDAMEEIIETFRDVDLSYTEMVKDGNGEIISTSTVYIDSSFGLTPQLIEMRKYLYMSSLIVPE